MIYHINTKWPCVVSIGSNFLLTFHFSSHPHLLITHVSILLSAQSFTQQIIAPVCL